MEYKSANQKAVFLKLQGYNAAAALEGTFAADYLRAWERAAEDGWKAATDALVRRFPAAFPREHYTQVGGCTAVALHCTHSA
jgi:hypothetical protein